MLDVLSNPALKLRHYRNIVALPALSTATKRHDHCLTVLHIQPIFAQKGVVFTNEDPNSVFLS